MMFRRNKSKSFGKFRRLAAVITAVALTVSLAPMMGVGAFAESVEANGGVAAFAMEVAGTGDGTTQRSLPTENVGTGDGTMEVAGTGGGTAEGLFTTENVEVIGGMDIANVMRSSASGGADVSSACDVVDGTVVTEFFGKLFGRE